MRQKKRKEQNKRHNNRKDSFFYKLPGMFFVLLFPLILLLAAGITENTAQAAGAKISISSKNRTYTKGDTVYVVITVSSSDSIQGFEGYFSYDNSVLQFITGGSVVHGNDDEFQISDTDRSSSETKIKYSIKFRARKKGMTTITLQKPYNVIADDDDSTKMSVSYNSLDINVISKKAAAKKNSQETASPSPSAEQSGQPKEEGASQNAPSENQPSGSSLPDAAQPDSSQEPQEGGMPSASPEASAAPSENAGISVTTILNIEELEDETLIPSGFSETETEIDGKTLTCYTLNGREDGNYILFYGTQKEEEEDTPAFYLYDKSSAMLIPYDSVRSLYRSMNEKDLIDSSSDRTIQSLKYVIAIMGVFCALMLILAIMFRIRYSSKK